MKNKMLERKLRRANRVRNKLRENKERVRLTVFRSNTNFYAQLVDDRKGTTLLSVNTKEIKVEKGMKKIEAAELAGELLAQKAKDKKISKVVFDKGSYKYHGRLKAFADGARKGGLTF